MAVSGEYRILVHGFEFRGGGNYALSVDAFRAEPLAIGAEAQVQLGGDGRAHLRLEASEDEILVPTVRGRWTGLNCLDPRGAPLADWEGSFRVELAGEHVLALQGPSGGRLSLRVATARRGALADGYALRDALQPGAMHVYELFQEPLDFRLVELALPSGLSSRLVRAARSDAAVLRERGFDLRSLPVLSKGARRRYASVFGRRGRYELQVLSRAAVEVEYSVRLMDPSRPLVPGTPAAGELYVGDSDFYRFDGAPGQLLQVDLRSGSFDPFLRLYDPEGRELAKNDDGGEDLDSRLGHLVREGGRYLLQVSARGDGGGGAYTLALAEHAIPTLVPGEVQTVVLGGEARRYWHFDGRAGETLLLSVRSRTADPRLEVLGPGGVLVGQNDDGGVDRDSLLPLRVEQGGRHTFWVSAAGEGECEVRLIALD